VRFRSKKTERTYRARRTLVEQLLAERPVCERCGSARSTEVHELRSRARGGSILDPGNCVTFCHSCHHFVTVSPLTAAAEGWLLPSWTDTPPTGKEPAA
jgi:5-methylcytosine-specific restriction endonuclease McrA